MISVLLITLRNWGDRSDRDLPLVIVSEFDGTTYLCWARRGEDITTYGGLHNVREGSRKRISITRQHATAYKLEDRVRGE
jgi:hypothetical protein